MDPIIILIILLTIFVILSIMSFKSDDGTNESYIGSIFGFLFGAIAALFASGVLFALAVRIFQM